MANLDGLGRLTSVGENVYIGPGPNNGLPNGLTDLSGLDMLTGVDRNVEIVGAGLTSLDGLENLEYIGHVYGVSTCRFHPYWDPSIPTTVSRTTRVQSASIGPL